MVVRLKLEHGRWKIDLEIESRESTVDKVDKFTELRKATIGCASALYMLIAQCLQQYGNI